MGVSRSEKECITLIKNDDYMNDLLNNNRIGHILSLITDLIRSMDFEYSRPFEGKRREIQDELRNLYNDSKIKDNTVLKNYYHGLFLANQLEHLGIISDYYNKFCVNLMVKSDPTENDVKINTRLLCRSIATSCFLYCITTDVNYYDATFEVRKGSFHAAIEKGIIDRKPTELKAHFIDMSKVRQEEVKPKFYIDPDKQMYTFLFLDDFKKNKQIKDVDSRKPYAKYDEVIKHLIYLIDFSFRPFNNYIGKMVLTDGDFDKRVRKASPSALSHYTEVVNAIYSALDNLKLVRIYERNKKSPRWFYTNVFAHEGIKNNLEYILDVITHFDGYFSREIIEKEGGDLELSDRMDGFFFDKVLQEYDRTFKNHKDTHHIEAKNFFYIPNNVLSEEKKEEPSKKDFEPFEFFDEPVKAGNPSASALIVKERYKETTCPESAVAKINVENKNNESGECKMNFNKVFNFDGIGIDKSGAFKLSLLGLAIKNNEGAYVCYNGTEMVNVMDMIVDAGDMVFKLPAQTVKEGDLIISHKEPLYVKYVREDGAVEVLNPLSDKEEVVRPQKSLLGINFFLKVTSFMDAFQPQGADEAVSVGAGPLGGINPMMLMMMGGFGDSKTGDKEGGMMEMLVMSQIMGGQAGGNGLQLNSLLPLMMMSGKGEGKGDMMQMLMFSQMLGGSGLFQPAAGNIAATRQVAAPRVTAPKATTPKATTGAKRGRKAATKTTDVVVTE